MSQVPSSGATMVAEISAVEEFSDHKVKSDGAVVSLSAVITATEQRGFADSDTAQVDAQVTGVDQYGRSDEAVVTMTAVVSGVDGKLWTDAAVASLVAEVSGSDSTTHAYTDAATVSLVAVPQAAESHEIDDYHTVKLVAVISALDEHQFPADAAVVTMVGVPSAVDVNAKWYTDATDVPLVGVPSALDSQHGIEAATVTSVGVPSGIDGQGYSDSATAKVIGAPSGVDGKTWSDSGTVTTVGIASGVEDYHQPATAVQLFGAWHYGGSGSPGDPSRFLDMDLGAIASAGDWFIVGIVSSAGNSAPGSSDLVVSDNVSGTTGWAALIDTSLGSGGYGAGTTHISYWRKQCVGGESHVYTEFGGSTNKSVSGAWVKTPTQPNLYVIDDAPLTWSGSQMEYTAVNFPTTNNETYIAIMLGGGSGVSNPSSAGMTTPLETDTIYELASGECWSRTSYNNVQAGHATTDTFSVIATPQIPAYVAFFGIH